MTCRFISSCDHDNIETVLVWWYWSYVTSLWAVTVRVCVHVVFRTRGTGRWWERCAPPTETACAQRSSSSEISSTRSQRSRHSATIRTELVWHAHHTQCWVWLLNNYCNLIAFPLKKYSYFFCNLITMTSYVIELNTVPNLKSQPNIEYIYCINFTTTLLSVNKQ